MTQFYTIMRVIDSHVRIRWFPTPWICHIIIIFVLIIVSALIISFICILVLASQPNYFLIRAL